MIIAIQAIPCPTCGNKAVRVGAQDYCDVYVCENDSTHLTRILVGAPRKEWKDKDEVDTRIDEERN